jgi:glycosyltransferase involved in cell wall biosynthesis
MRKGVAKAPSAVPRVAFVVQRCGQAVNGGAELYCRVLAERLSAGVPVDILTTCALDYFTWRNHFPEGEERLSERCRILRFAVDRQRSLADFRGCVERLQRASAGTRSAADEAAWALEQGPLSGALSRYIEAHHTHYDAFFFFCYQYATTWQNVPLVGERAYVVTLAHDEWTLAFGHHDAVARAPRALLCQTPEERALVEARFGGLARRIETLAIGIDAPPDANAERFRRRHGIERPFLLYVGRVEAAKGCPQLFQHYLAGLAAARDPAAWPDLVVVGRAAIAIPHHPRIHYLGFIDEADKADAIAACTALVNPSDSESLSLVLLEAWSQSRPVLVNAASPVLAGQVARSGGGLAYGDPLAFAAGIYALGDPDAGRILGARGARYVAAHYAWPDILRRYRDLIDECR